VRYKGKLSTETVEAVEETAKIAEADVRAAIEGLDLSDMGEDAIDFRAMLLRHEAVFKGLGCAMGEQFRISVPPDFALMKLDCPPRRRSEKERAQLRPLHRRDSLNYGYTVLRRPKSSMRRS
jgi:hypothetical protein